MSSVKKKGFVLGVIAALLLFAAGIVVFSKEATFARAQEVETDGWFNFTQVTDGAGEQSYSVAVRTAAKSTIETALIPETYRGLPVTEIAINGFMSCAKLKKVVLPVTVKKIGNNAFMNCTQLERVGMPCVESIGMNAFAMCPKLDRPYFPCTVKSVGANVLRNNANTVYLQSSEEEISAEWQSTWKNYFTGEIIYGRSPEETVNYRQIFDTRKERVIGYEITEIGASTDDIVIYNSYRENEDSEYLPVLNICAKAFMYSFANSITFKDRSADDIDAPAFSHKINLRSNAFIAYFGQEVVFEVGVTLDNPWDENDLAESDYDSLENVGDENGKSIKVFENSTIKSVTLPSDIELIPERMFYGCYGLESIKYSGREYDGTNEVFASKIGAEAFNSCVALSNITLTSCIKEVGENTFYDWGYNNKVQTINVDYYEGYLPAGWDPNWCGSSWDAAVIDYKELTYIDIDLQDGEGNKLTIGVKPGFEMPAIDKPQRPGYTFLGIYSEKQGRGLQYYTDGMEIRAPWQEGEPTTLYANWEAIEYEILYSEEFPYIPDNYPRTFTVEDEIIFEPFEYKGYKYTCKPSVIKKNTAGNVDIAFDKTPVRYEINYEGDLKGNAKPDVKEYTVEKEVVFDKLQCEGYTFEWVPASIPLGSTGEMTVIAVWTPKTYNITYDLGYTHEATHGNPSFYTYNEELVLTSAICGGYYVTWDKTSIPAGTIGDVTVTASYVEKTLNQCYANGVYEIWTKNQFEDLRTQPNYGNGRTYKLMDNIWAGNSNGGNSGYWTPIASFKGILDGNGHSVTSYTLVTSGGGNIGLFGINEGTIKNLTLGIRYTVENTLSDVNVGAFAGVNAGIISNCGITPVFNRPYFICKAKGDSYAGCYVGINRNTIENCNGGDMIRGSCNMGIVAGKNEYIIRKCSVGGDIYFDYCDYNACIGGIVGLQTAGSVTGCYYTDGFIKLMNYETSTGVQMSYNVQLQPCVGVIIGYRQGGKSSGNDWAVTYRNHVLVGSSLTVIDIGFLHHNQALYVKEAECGRTN